MNCNPVHDMGEETCYEAVIHVVPEKSSFQDPNFATMFTVKKGWHHCPAPANLQFKVRFDDTKPFIRIRVKPALIAHRCPSNGHPIPVSANEQVQICHGEFFSVRPANQHLTHATIMFRLAISQQHSQSNTEIQPTPEAMHTSKISKKRKQKGPALTKTSPQKRRKGKKTDMEHTQTHLTSPTSDPAAHPPRSPLFAAPEGLVAGLQGQDLTLNMGWEVHTPPQALQESGEGEQGVGDGRAVEEANYDQYEAVLRDAADVTVVLQMLKMRHDSAQIVSSCLRVLRDMIDEAPAPNTSGKMAPLPWPDILPTLITALTEHAESVSVVQDTLTCLFHATQRLSHAVESKDTAEKDATVAMLLGILPHTLPLLNTPTITTGSVKLACNTVCCIIDCLAPLSAHNPTVWDALSPCAPSLHAALKTRESELVRDQALSGLCRLATAGPVEGGLEFTAGLAVVRATKCLPVVLATLERHPGSRSLQRKGRELLRLLCRGHEEFQIVAVARKAVPLLIGSLAHALSLDDLDMLPSALTTLNTLGTHVTGKLLQANRLATVLSAMEAALAAITSAEEQKRSEVGAEVLGHGASLIERVAASCPSGQEAVARAGGIAILMRAVLESHQLHVAVASLRALSASFAKCVAAQDACTRQGIQALVRLLKAHSRNDMLVVYLSQAIRHALDGSASNTTVATDLNVPTTLAELLREGPLDTVTSTVAILKTIHTICVQDQRASLQLLTNGFLAFPGTVLLITSDGNDVTLSVLALCAVVLEHAARTRYAVEYDATVANEALVDSLCATIRNTHLGVRVREKACMALCNLLAADLKSQSILCDVSEGLQSVLGLGLWCLDEDSRDTSISRILILVLTTLEYACKDSGRSQDQLRSHGVGWLVRRILKEQQAQPKVVERAARFMAAYVRGNTTNLQRAMNMLSQIIAGLTPHLSSSYVRRSVCSIVSGVLGLVQSDPSAHNPTVLVPAAPTILQIADLEIENLADVGNTTNLLWCILRALPNTSLLRGVDIFSPLNSAVEKHMSNVSIVCSVYGVFGCVIKQDRAVLDSVPPRTVHILAHAVKTHRTSSKVWGVVTPVICALAARSSDDKRRSQTLSLFDPVLTEVLRTSVQNAELVKCVLRCHIALSARTSPGTGAVVEHVVKALYTHRRSAKLVILALTVLSRFAMDETLKITIRQSGGIAGIIMALQDASDREVEVRGLGILAALASDHENCKRMYDAGCAAVVQELRKKRGDTAVSADITTLETRLKQFSGH